MPDAGDTISSELVSKIKSNPAFFVSLSDSELQDVIGYKVEDFSAALRKDRLDTKFYQEACEKELDRRMGLKEATELLKLYDRASREKTLNSSEAGSKRQRNDTM